MTLNLQNVLVILGAIVVFIIYLIWQWQHRTPGRSKTAGGGGRDSRKDEPALDGFDEPDDWEEMPDYSAKEADSPERGQRENRNIRSAQGFDDDRVAAENSGEGAIPEDTFTPDSAAATPANTEIEDLTAVAPVGGRPDGRGGDSRAPVFGAPISESQAAGFRSSIDGFERLSQIDYWVKITGERDVGRESVLAIYRDESIGFTKTHSIHGLKTPEKRWYNLENEAEDSRFDDLVLTIQLADCNGAISEGEMARFSALVSRLSEGTGREFVFMTTVENALAQAVALAEFVERFDSLFVINIHPRDGQRFQGTLIDRCAPQTGLERDDSQYYSRLKSVGKDKVTLYSLANMSNTGRFYFENMKLFNTAGLVFFTRPAVNRSPGAVFSEMVDTAKAFAARIEGVVSSPDHNDLSQEVADEIRKSIEQVAAEMERLGIPAGSDEATRIF